MYSLGHQNVEIPNKIQNNLCYHGKCSQMLFLLYLLSLVSVTVVIANSICQ